MGQAQKKIEIHEAIVIDTLASAKELREAGFTEQQAEAQVSIMSKALSRIVQDNLATKQDIADIQSSITDLKRDIANTATKAELTTLKRDVANTVTKAELFASKFEMIKWYIGIAFVQAGFIVGMFHYFH